MLREAVLERRAFLQGLAAAGVLAACSGGDDSSSSRPKPKAKPAASVKPFDPDRPYWEQGNFAMVEDEVTETKLEVTGAIPSSLSGLYVRTGSNPPTKTSPHWFLGDGMVHGVRIEQGKAAWYRNRYVRTTLHEQRKEFQDAGVPGKDVNQSNVAVAWHGDKLMTLGEVGWPYELSPEDLSTVGPWDFAGKLATWMTAHPKIDPATGQMHFFGYGFADPLLTYHVADAQGRLVHSEPVAIDTATMVHDFAVTDQDVIFWQGPVMFALDDPDALATGFPFKWDPSGPSQIGVMPLGGPASKIRWIDVDPFMVFHGLNAHRDGDEVVAQVHKVPSAFGPDGDLLPSHLTEWRIDTSGPQLKLKEQRLSDINMDLPSIDRRHVGRQARHGWCATIDIDGPYGFEFAGLNHIDLKTGKDDRWEPGPMERGGEAFFAADPGSDTEGEGWIMSFLYDRTTDRSSLGIFDALAVADGPVARIHLPVRVPYGFHGLWVADA